MPPDLKTAADLKKETEPGTDAPAYLRLAETIKRQILDGVYQYGGRIPSEAALCKTSGLALLTVRQALGVLVDEGLLERFPGRGTYVKELSWRGANFSIDGLVDRVGSGDTQVRIVRTEVRRATAGIAERLGISLGDSVVYLKRTISTAGSVFLIQEGHLLLDPERPIMEAELEATYLTGLFTGSGQGLIKTAHLGISPVALSEEDCRLLGREPGTVAFKLEYVFHDAATAPLAVGSFLTPDDTLKLSASIGVRLGAKNGHGGH
jgi:Transcriptional regulators